ncbi:MEKHLA domain-containing protein [Xylophilus rhododendri]|uniref:MEKHLA domain-containing protein n=1 Tax=Xylophilus rhododendri TaxID=2697032 RepID=A0A857J7Z4_9BURK|nr:diguanylate cyclase [Xylophilus rhododendri]QHI98905.1 MEKHLA domain-containing protein [Xylophilus rhododendri]
MGDRLGRFEVLEVLYRGEASTVLRCLQDERPLVVKFLRNQALAVGDVARFRREYELSRRVRHSRVVSAETLGSHDGALYLTMPDDGAVALRDLLRQGPLPLADALFVALALADALAEVHAHDILHKDVAPGNVVMDLARGVVKLIDFGISAEISSERPALAAPAELEGTLACMAPEQTGRTNGDVDYRCDFYGLGATLYTMLAGSAPFTVQDPVALVHAHLALAPPPLAELRPDAPAALCAVVERLLAKQPDGRYQSHEALRRDLAYLQTHLALPDALAGWEPAMGDLPQRFQLPAWLYGREAETQRLLAAFEVAAGGPAQVVLVEGPSGIGKTALVHEVLRALLARRGEMIEGKFNQFGQQAPGAAFAQALRQRARQLLAGSLEHQRPWREALAAQLGANAHLAVQAVPELALLFDEPPRDVPPLGPQEAENRFLRTLCSCFSALCSAQQPLVVFIDDLQWADRVSRRLLRELALDDGLRHLLVVGAFRSDEVGDEHPLARDIEGWTDGDRAPLRLSVGPLQVADVVALCADTLSRAADDEELAELAALCHEKTGGNPFFLGRFLQDLQRRRLIWRDPDGPRWRWSLVQIGRERIAENVVALMLEQLRRLPELTRELLTIAACLDARFRLQTLAQIRGEGEDAVLRGLEPALASGVLAPTDVRYKWVGVLDAAERAGLEVELAFAHDRVQEAAYLLLPPERRAALHLRIGRMLCATMDTAVPDFAVVNHLNRGATLILHDADGRAERARLAAWNTRLSFLARDRASFDLAADHAARAVALSGTAAWKGDRAGALVLHAHAARMAGLTGDDAAMQSLIEAAMDQSLQAHERALLLDVRVEASYGLGRLDETIELGLQALALLDLALPQVNAPADVLRLVAEVRAEVEALGIAALEDLPAMQAPLPLQQLAVIARMTAAAYIARPALLPLLTVVQIRLMLAHGHAPLALSAYTVLGLLVAELLGEYRFGWMLGRMSLGLIERHGWQPVQAHAGFSFGAFLQHWVEPPRPTLPAWIEVHRNGLENGNLRHASLALVLHGSHALLGGMPLAQVEPLLARHLGVLRRIRQPVAHDYVQVLHESVRALQRPHLLSRPLEHDGWRREATLEGFAARKDQTGALFVHVFECCLLALAGRHAEAVAAGESAAALFSAGRGLGMVAFCIYFTASARLALVREGRPPEGWQQQVDAALARFGPWLAASPRLLPLQQLLIAQRAAVAGEDATMRQALDQALAAVADPDELMLLAIVRQQRALLLDMPAEQAEARAVLLRWGAPAAAAALFGGGHAPTVAASAARTLDLGALMKAVQAVTAEIAFAPLLQRLLQVLRENAGAVRVAVVLRGGEGWLLQADNEAPPGAPSPEALALEQAGARLPLEILRTVLATGQPVRTDDALSEHPWSRLDYIARRPVRSLLCMPLLRQGVVSGALYLENDEAIGAFPAQRIEFLQLLLGNLVSALENARLYAEVRGLADSLEARVAERTRELRASEQRTLAILHNIPLPVVVSRTSDDTFVYANERAAALAGMSAQALIGRPPHSMYRNPAERDRMMALFQRNGLVQDFEANLVDARGRDFWALISLVPVMYDGEPGRLSTVVDITARKTEEQALRRAAATDDLTGLAGRGHFMRMASQELTEALVHGRPMALVMLDVDHFKRINDRYGHAAGDGVLREVARLCEEVTRAQDLAGRIGGEEFCLLLPDADIEAAMTLAERLRATLARHPLEVGGETLTLSASLGVAQARAGDSISLLLARADAALYVAKRSGRNRVSAA